MNRYKSLFTLILITIFLLPTLSLAALAVDDSIQPRYQVTSCPVCDADNFRNEGIINDTYYDNPTYCEANIEIVGQNHKHLFIEQYSLCKCYSCGYEDKTNRPPYPREYCPELQKYIEFGR